MIKDILVQYCDLQEEIKEKRKKIDRLENDIEKIESEGAVIDSVKGGKGGIQHFKITGFPYPIYSKKKTILRIRKNRLIERELELLELTNKTEEYIESVGNSRIRRILTMRYIDELSWIQVANRIGRSATADSVRMEHNRFLEI